jgi:hypothetical protein
VLEPRRLADLSADDAILAMAVVRMDSLHGDRNFQPGEKVGVVVEER